MSQVTGHTPHVTYHRSHVTRLKFARTSRVNSNITDSHDLNIYNHQLFLALNVGPVRKRLRRVALVLRPIQIVVVFDVRASDKTEVTKRVIKSDERTKGNKFSD
jgi:hypothetical protein